MPLHPACDAWVAAPPSSDAPQKGLKGSHCQQHLGIQSESETQGRGFPRRLKAGSKSNCPDSEVMSRVCLMARDAVLECASWLPHVPEKKQISGFVLKLVLGRGLMSASDGACIGECERT
jgi:hypothetical protein